MLKKCTFPLWAQTHLSFSFNLQFLYKLKFKVHLSKTVGFFIFDPLLFLLKFMFLFNKKHRLCGFKCHNFFQNKSNKKATQSFVPRPLIFNLQQEVWEFSNICINWSSWKTDLETNFLNLGNSSFEYVTFSQ